MRYFMSGLFDAIANGLHATANRVREASLTTEELEFRTQAKRGLEFIKVASLVAVFANLFFVAMLPCVFNIFLLAAVSFGAYEIYNVANNVVEMLEKSAVEVVARCSRENLIAQVTKNTFVAKSIINIINPNLDKIIFTTRQQT